MKVTQKEQRERLKRNEQKWTKPLMEAGFTVIPSVIIERQKALGLDAVDVNILLHLAMYWWHADNPPHPSKATIAEAIGVHPSTVRRHITRLVKDGLIERVERFSTSGGQMTNVYRFDGLIKGATPYAEEAIVEREKRREDAKDRPRRKRARLRMVKGTGKDA